MINAQTSVNDFQIDNFLEKSRETKKSIDKISVFPSIITDNFQVTLNQKNTQAVVQLFSLDGEKILEQNISKDEPSVQAYGLEDDIYLINILDDRGEVIHSEWIVVEK